MCVCDGIGAVVCICHAWMVDVRGASAHECSFTLSSSRRSAKHHRSHARSPSLSIQSRYMKQKHALGRSSLNYFVFEPDPTSVALRLISPFRPRVQSRPHHHHHHQHHHQPPPHHPPPATLLSMSMKRRRTLGRRGCQWRPPDACSCVMDYLYVTNVYVCIYICNYLPL